MSFSQHNQGDKDLKAPVETDDFQHNELYHIAGLKNGIADIKEVILSDKAKEAWQNASFGQGLVGIAHVKAGTNTLIIDLIPAFNNIKTAEDRNTMRNIKGELYGPTECVDTEEPLGSNTGTIHTDSVKILGLQSEKTIFGFGIFKGQPGEDLIRKLRNKSYSLNSITIKYNPEFTLYHYFNNAKTYEALKEHYNNYFNDRSLPKDMTFLIANELLRSLPSLPFDEKKQAGNLLTTINKIDELTSRLDFSDENHWEKIKHDLDDKSKTIAKTIAHASARNLVDVVKNGIESLEKNCKTLSENKKENYIDLYNSYLNQRSESSAYFLAIKYGHLDSLMMVLDATPQSERYENLLIESFLLSVKFNRLSILKYLIEKIDLSKINISELLENDLSKYGLQNKTLKDLIIESGNTEIIAILDDKLPGTKELILSKISKSDWFNITENIEKSEFAEAMLPYLTTHDNINHYKNEEGLTLLQSAAQIGSNKVVKLLLELRANINSDDLSVPPTLYLAATKGQLDTIALLLENKADALSTIAAENLQLTLIDTILMQWSDEQKESTPKVQEVQQKIIKLFMEAGVSVTQQEFFTLNTAIALGNILIIHDILSKIHDEKPNEYQSVVVQMMKVAIENNKKDVLNMLVKNHNADISLELIKLAIEKDKSSSTEVASYLLLLINKPLRELAAKYKNNLSISHVISQLSKNETARRLNDFAVKIRSLPERLSLHMLAQAVSTKNELDILLLDYTAVRDYLLHSEELLKNLVELAVMAHNDEVVQHFIKDSATTQLKIDADEITVDQLRAEASRLSLDEWTINTLFPKPLDHKAEARTSEIGMFGQQPETPKPVINSASKLKPGGN